MNEWLEEPKDDEVERAQEEDFAPDSLTMLLALSQNATEQERIIRDFYIDAWQRGTLPVVEVNLSFRTGPKAHNLHSWAVLAGRQEDRMIVYRLPKFGILEPRGPGKLPYLDIARPSVLTPDLIPMLAENYRLNFKKP